MFIVPLISAQVPNFNFVGMWNEIGTNQNQSVEVCALVEFVLLYRTAYDTFHVHVPHPTGTFVERVVTKSPCRKKFKKLFDVSSSVNPSER